MKYDDLGQELPDPTRLEVPVGFARPETIEQKIARAIYTHEWNKRMMEKGVETPYEADDFDVSDDVELPTTQYELSAMQEDAYMERRSEQPMATPAGRTGNTPPEKPVAPAGEASGKEASEIVRST